MIIFLPIFHLMAYLYLCGTERNVVRFQQLIHGMARDFGAFRQPRIAEDEPEPLFTLWFRAMGIFLLLMLAIVDLGIVIRVCTYLRQIVTGQ
jgi:hypothetical protein